MSQILDSYKQHTKDRKALGIPPLALNTDQTKEVITLLSNGSEDTYLLTLFTSYINPGVDDSAYLKADFLNNIIQDGASSKQISKLDAIKILGSMLGGYNINPLINALKLDDTLASASVVELKHTLLIYNSFETIKDLMSEGNKYAKEIITSWANAEWFTSKPKLADELSLAVLKVDGETNTDDLSPASEAFTRSDIPLHANCMLTSKMPDALDIIKDLKSKGHEIAYVGDIVGTGSSRKSAINSIQWHLGDELDSVPNKRTGGVVIGATIAPIFFNTAEDSGALPIQADVSQLNTGDIITVKPYEGKIYKDGQVVSEFELTPNTLVDELRAGGRIPLIIGRNLTTKARAVLGLGTSDIFTTPAQPKDDGSGYTLAQKMVGKACGVEGIKPGVYCEPIATTVGSQDTTGPMTRDEIKELAALSFGSDFVLQSFCHTAAYPKPSDIITHETLPSFISTRGGVSLRPGDGVIHSWLNRMLLPDTVGTGGDSHTRFPIGISFPAGSGLVAFAGVTGGMPLNMPESVLVRFKGKLQDGITLRDLVNAIPYQAIKEGILTVEKKGKKNIFAGKVLEIEGLGDLKVEQAFELSDASAERSASACAIKLDKEPIIEYLKSNIELINQMIANGYSDAKTLTRRAEKMQEWIDTPTLLEADKDAKYAHILEIDLADIKEPILACPNDPDDVATLTEILADPKRPKNIDEVFVGSCMTNIGLFRALGEILEGEGQVPTRLWIVPPTKMDKNQLTNEGYYSTFASAGARLEIPGCSLCMGNQARVKDDTTVFSTSTRNFNNRMGTGAQVYLGSAELAAVCALLGKIPTVAEYMDIVKSKITKDSMERIYKYLSFDELTSEQVKSLIS